MVDLYFLVLWLAVFDKSTCVQSVSVLDSNPENWWLGSGASVIARIYVACLATRQGIHRNPVSPLGGGVVDSGLRIPLLPLGGLFSTVH